MARCANCEKLDRSKSSVEPHADLVLLGTHDYHAGHRAYVERYRCQTCATPWTRDMDKRDSGAIWEDGAQ